MAIALITHASGPRIAVGSNPIPYCNVGAPTTGTLWLAIALAADTTRAFQGGRADYTTPPATSVDFAYETSPFSDTLKAQAGISIDAYTNGDDHFLGMEQTGGGTLSGDECGILYAFKLTGVKTGATPINAAVFAPGDTVNGTEKKVDITTTVDNCAIVAVGVSVNALSAASGDSSSILSLTDLTSSNTNYSKGSFLADAGTAGAKTARFEVLNGTTWILAVALEPAVAAASQAPRTRHLLNMMGA
jgi:hypothetical protein